MRPRIQPGTAKEIGRVNFAIAWVLGAVSGGSPPHIFTTLARHRGLFRKWLRFASALMPGGVLPRVDSELLILRTAHNCRCDYEWSQHERIAQTAGLTAEQVQRVRDGHRAEGWSTRQGLLLEAADELHSERTLSDELWEKLRPLFSEVELIELCMLVGHYEMLAMMLNGLAVQPDAFTAQQPPRILRLLQGLDDRRRRRSSR